MKYFCNLSFKIFGWWLTCVIKTVNFKLQIRENMVNYFNLCFNVLSVCFTFIQFLQLLMEDRTILKLTNGQVHFRFISFSRILLLTDIYRRLQELNFKQKGLKILKTNFEPKWWKIQKSQIESECQRKEKNIYLPMSNSLILICWAFS